MKQKITIKLDIQYEDSQTTAQAVAEEIALINFEYPIFSVKLVGVEVERKETKNEKR